MKIKVKNLGPIDEAEFELGDFTIICGNNNTGKTYLSYALDGFLETWKGRLTIELLEREKKALFATGSIEVDLNEYRNRAQKFVDGMCETYKIDLYDIFATKVGFFSETSFEVEIPNLEPLDSFERVFGSAKASLFKVSKNHGKPTVQISLIVDKENTQIPKELIFNRISSALIEILFSKVFPSTFISSAERTGAAIFRKELDFARNRMLDHLKEEKEVSPYQFLQEVYGDYALPVKNNVDFSRRLESVSRETSYLEKEHPEVVAAFVSLIGGEYKVTRNDELYFIPKKGKVKLTLGESSSAVRSLVDLYFYLKHVAQKNDLLVIDEPELNLHPQNQRLLARLLARLVNCGIKVFITTHSDYIIKELNILITLCGDENYLDEIRRRERYDKEELLRVDKFRVYEATTIKKGKKLFTTLVSADINQEEGIELKSFDEAIREMNRIQDDIFYGGEV